MGFESRFKRLSESGKKGEENLADEMHSGVEEIVLDKKYVFHVPLCRFSKGSLVKLDIGIDGLLEELSKNGFDALYITKTKGYYKSRCFDELLITIFAGESENPQDIFMHWFSKNNDVLRQEAMAYECGNEMVIINL